jgi:hypothetical protein
MPCPTLGPPLDPARTLRLVTRSGRARPSFGIAGQWNGYSEQNVLKTRSHTLVITPKLHGVLP